MSQTGPPIQTATPPDTAAEQPRSYWDIVWQQFGKNRAATTCAWTLAPLFLMAIFAPVIASNEPFAFHDGDQWIYPWFRAVMNPQQAVDFVFNMALIGFVPWALVALGLNWRWQRRRIHVRRRLVWSLGLYAVLIAVLCGVFSFEQLRPDNKFRQRDFSTEQYASDGAMRGWYPPIPFGPTEQDLRAIFKPPGFTAADTGELSRSTDAVPHLLGTDDTGSDVLVRMIYGTRISLTVGFIAVGLYISIGIVVGALAGYFGGMVDILISRVIEIVLLFPAFFLILTLVALIGPSIYIIMLVIGITGWPTTARLIRGEVLKQRGNDYVAAARSLGASHLRVIFRHVLPNALSPAMVAAPFGVAGAIITEAGLSLLGFGVQPPAPSWGTLLKQGSENYTYWWLVVVPALAMFFTVTIFNLVGSGLRDAMDPRLRV